MNKELILQMQSQFDALAHTHPEATDVEFWFARKLQVRDFTKMVGAPNSAVPTP